MKSASELDAADPLAPFRDLFVHDAQESDLIYLDGNSLGRQPSAVSEVLERVVHEEWATRLIRGWNEGWLDISGSVGDLIGSLLHAQPGEVTLAENTSVCLYKVATAALKTQSDRKKLVTDSENFPSDIQILGSACASAGHNLSLIHI